MLTVTPRVAPSIYLSIYPIVWLTVGAPLDFTTSFLHSSLCRGLWIEEIPLVSGCCTLLGRVDTTGPHPSPKSLTCWFQAPRPGPRLSRRAKPREGVMLTLHHWAKNLHDAGYRPRWMNFSQVLNGYVFKTKASHLDGGHWLWPGMEKDGLHYATLPKIHYIKMANWFIHQ